MVGKLKKVLSNPRFALRYGIAVVRRLRMRRVVKDGKEYIAYKGELYPDFLFKKKAMKGIEEKARAYCTGTGLDIGAGAYPYPGATPIENRPGENAYELGRFRDGSLDYIFSSHCLEHLEHWHEALGLWVRKLSQGGVLFLYVPHESMALWRPGEACGIQHAWSPTHEVLVPFLEARGMQVIEYEPFRDHLYSFHIVAKKK